MDKGINNAGQNRGQAPQRFPVVNPNSGFGYIPDSEADAARVVQAAQANGSMNGARTDAAAVQTPQAAGFVPQAVVTPQAMGQMPQATQSRMAMPRPAPQVQAARPATRRKEPVQTPPSMNTFPQAVMQPPRPRPVQPAPMPQPTTVSPSFAQTMSPPAMTQTFSPSMNQPYSPSINLTLAMENCGARESAAGAQQTAVGGVSAQAPQLAAPSASAVSGQMAVAPACFGESARPYADPLRALAAEKYRDCLYYSCLSRRAPRQSSRRLLCRIGRDDLCNCRKLAAAYFLITGRQFRPTRGTVDPVCVPCSFACGLRERYQAESAGSVRFQNFAAAVSDPCLKKLARDISDDEAQHAQLLLEQIQCL